MTTQEHNEAVWIQNFRTLLSRLRKGVMHFLFLDTWPWRSKYAWRHGRARDLLICISNFRIFRRVEFRNCTDSLRVWNISKVKVLISAEVQFRNIERRTDRYQPRNEQGGVVQVGRNSKVKTKELFVRKKENLLCWQLNTQRSEIPGWVSLRTSGLETFRRLDQDRSEARDRSCVLLQL